MRTSPPRRTRSAARWPMERSEPRRALTHLRPCLLQEGSRRCHEGHSGLRAGELRPVVQTRTRHREAYGEGDRGDGCGRDGWGRTAATSRRLTAPSPHSTRPRGSRGRRSSAFVRERHAPIDARSEPALFKLAAGDTRAPERPGQPSSASALHQRVAVGRAASGRSFAPRCRCERACWRLAPSARSAIVRSRCRASCSRTWLVWKHLRPRGRALQALCQRGKAGSGAGRCCGLDCGSPARHPEREGALSPRRCDAATAALT